MDFRWQLYRVAPLDAHENQTAVTEAGLAEEVTGLGGTLFSEVARSAEEIWRRVYEGKTEVTHKALSPLRTLHGKLTGLSFVEPHVAPVAEIIKAALKRIPVKGTITGPDLLMLQGLVCMLKDSGSLVLHAQKLIEGYGPATVLDALLSGAGSSTSGEPSGVDNIVDGQADEENSSDDAPVLPEIPATTPSPEIPSMGLW